MTTVPGSPPTGPPDLAGMRIDAVCFIHDFVEVHLGEWVLTGLTRPFGTNGCQGMNPLTMVPLIGRTVDALVVVEGEYVALDAAENRLAFPIGGPTASGPESVRLFHPGVPELGVGRQLWVW